MNPDPGAQYQQLQKRLSQIGWIARGSALARHYTLRVAGRAKRCGPYYSLTWKEAGKTRTRALSAEQYRLFRHAIANHKALDKILRSMRSLSLRFINRSTQGVLKRNRVNPTKSPR